MTKIDRINELNQGIRDLEYAINVFKPGANIIRGNGSKDIRGIIRLETKTRLSILGSRWFGVGTHEVEIELPNTLVPDIEKLMIERCNLLRKELSSLLGNT
jgi:hypothetical protein